MAVTLLKHTEKYAGTNAERLAMDVSRVGVGSTFFEWDTSKLYVLSPTGWVEKNGSVQIDNIASGDTNIGNVDIASAIPAGGNVIGKFGIDQTTPGTTNKVVAELSGSNLPLVAGTANIGDVDVLTLPKDILQEQQTEADATLGVLTFAATIETIEIYNTDAANAGTFTVNGIDIIVPATKSFMSAIGGTASAEVTVTGATTYIVSRYVQEVA